MKAVKNYKRTIFWIFLGVILAAVGATAYFWINSFAQKGDDLLLRVLNNKETFIQESGQSGYLREYVQGTTGGAASAPDRYTLTDLDGDGTEEMVAHISGDPGKYLVLHIYNSKAYGFAFAEQDFQNLKADGSFIKSQNTYANYFYTLQFDGCQYRLTELAYHNSEKNKARINGQNATEPEVTLFAMDFWEKPAAKWTAGPEAIDPMVLYEAFLAGTATAKDNWEDRGLATYIPEDGVYGYAYIDMTGDGSPELCINIGAGKVRVFTVKNKGLVHWGTYGTSFGGLHSNGLYIDQVYDYNFSYLYYECRGLSENGSVVFSLNFSYEDKPYTDSDVYRFNGEEVSGEQYVEKTKKFMNCFNEESFWTFVPEETTQQPSSQNTDALLLKVLNNETPFLDESGNRLLLREHRLGKNVHDYILQPKYTLVDMDGDGSRELVLFVTPSIYGSYLLLRVYQGQVYGYVFDGKSFANLRQDGSFMQMDDDGNTSYVTLAFEGTGYKVFEQAYYNSAVNDIRVYRLGGKYTTDDRLHDYVVEFAQKAETLWVDCQNCTACPEKALYEAFLAGETTATDQYGEEKTADAFVENGSSLAGCSYTLLDMTGDGRPELCVYANLDMYIFTVEDSRIRHWHTEYMRYCHLLNNGAFLYLRQGGTPTYRRYRYYELDENANVKFQISFEWYDGSTVDIGKEYPDTYLIDGKTVSKEEYEEKTQQYLSIGYDTLVWLPPVGSSH